MFDTIQEFWNGLPPDARLGTKVFMLSRSEERRVGKEC
jgi:hypothetical protein